MSWSTFVIGTHKHDRVARFPDATATASVRRRDHFQFGLFTRVRWRSSIVFFFFNSLYCSCFSSKQTYLSLCVCMSVHTSMYFTFGEQHYILKLSLCCATCISVFLYFCISGCSLRLPDFCNAHSRIFCCFLLVLLFSFNKTALLFAHISAIRVNKNTKAYLINHCPREDSIKIIRHLPKVNKLVEKHW